MSVQRLSSGFDRLNKPVSVAPWVRPAEWLPLPSVEPSDQKVVGLYAIYGDANFIAFTCAGDYTVNWGDGVTENFASGVSAYHQYTYADAALNGTEITVAGLTYKQAVVQITPQGGSSLTSVNFNVRHTASSVAYTTGWLDIVVSSTALASLTIGALSPSVRFSTLNQFSLISSNTVSDFSYLFNNCNSLQSIPLFNSDSGTNFSNMFNNCSSLESVPLFNTAAGTNFSNMFGSCFSLKTVPPFNTAAGTLFNSMFSSCSSLQNVPLFNTAAGTNFSNMFAYCYCLQSVPLLNTAAGTNFGSMFNNCYSLKTVPLLNTAAGTNFSSMFSVCYSLQSIPLLNTAAATSIAGMFTGCTALNSAALGGTKTSVSYSNCKLSAAELDKIYTNLHDPVISQTITVTGNYGTAGDDPSIATAKGWTVTG